MESKDWISAKHKYIYTDKSYTELAKDYGVNRLTMMNGLKRNFPQTDFRGRKAEESEKRRAGKLAKAGEKREIAKLKFDNKVDAMDEKHLAIINLALDDALDSLQQGSLRAKDIKDIKELINLERAIANKRTTNDRVIVIRAEKPEDFEPLPEVMDGEFEVEE